MRHSVRGRAEFRTVVSIKTGDSLDDLVRLCIVPEKNTIIAEHPLISGFDVFKVRSKVSGPSNHSSATKCGSRAPDTCLRDGLFHFQRQCGTEPP
jgi:hypothetical protein